MKNRRLLVFSLTSIFFFGISFVIIYPGIKAMIEARQSLSQQRKEISTKKPARRTDSSISSPSKTIVDSPTEDESTIEDVPTPENEMPEDDDTSTDTLIETQIDEKVEQADAAPEKDSDEKQTISPEEQKILDEGHAIIEEAKAKQAEMLKSWEPVMVQMAIQLNSMSAEEQLKFIRQVDEMLRDTMPPEMPESDLDEMIKLFVSKLKEHGFSPRY